MKKPAEAPKPHEPQPPGVYRAANRNTCIRTSDDPRYVYFIAMSMEEFTVSRVALPGFDAVYESVPDYPPGRAARLYLETARAGKIPITREAEVLLSAIADAKFDRAATSPAPTVSKSHPTTTDEEQEMSEDVKPKKNPAPAKKAAEKPAAKKAAKKAAAKKAAKKAEATEPGTRGRAPNISGDAKIKLLVEKGANPKRGTAAERFALYKNGMTVDEYIAAGGKRADVNWDVGCGFIEVK